MQQTLGYDFIVLGLGPVGLLACNALGMRGYRVLGIDRMTSTYSFPRAIHLDDEVVRIMQSVGLGEQLLRHLKPMSGLELMDTDFNVMFRGYNKFPSGFASNHFLFFQPELEKILREGCNRYSNIALLYGTDVTGLKQTPCEVHIEASSGQLAHSRYLLGCDGARSFVRDTLGIGLNDLGFKKAALKIDAFELSPGGLKFDTVQKVCSPSKPWVRMQGVGNHRRWELNYDAGLSKEEIEKPEQVIRLLQETGVDTAKLEIVHAVMYYFKSVLAQKWRLDNIFLAGDAAHTTPPYVGQGMCAGFRDVMNLSWKLDAVIKKELPDNVLATYQTERYAHARELILLADLVGLIFTTRFWYVLKIFSKIPVLNHWLLNFKIPKTRDGRGFWGSGLAGRALFPQVKMPGHIYSDFLFSNKWALVSIGKSNTGALTNECEKAGLKHVELKEDNCYLTEIKAWAKQYWRHYFIVRPDLYIFSSGEDPIVLCNEFVTKKKQLWQY